ncbi:MAG: SGNH/GDSL hydrolase family protein [Myxococcota bacterium]
MTSVALLGDSVFDNQAYTGGGPDVAAHLRDLVPEPWRVTLCAVDGTTTTSLGPQLERVPKHVEHIVLSLGGNDALGEADLLALPVRSTTEALELFRERLNDFEQRYGWALDAVIDLGCSTTVCTIYDAPLGGGMAERAHTALMMFNDVILRQAVSRRVRVVELRLVCTTAEDFANEIEPSAAGGRKIARALLRPLGLPGDTEGATVVTGA